jgi:tetratricopeptide (TPR) repeat protein
MGDEWSLNLFEKLLLSGRIMCFYAYKLVLPIELIFIYPRWTVDTAAWWQYAFPIGVAAAVIILWLARRRLGRGPLAAVLFFCGTLVPALGFFDVYPMRFSFVADHFQYLASIGLIVLFAAAVVTAAGKLLARRRQGTLVAALALLAVLGVMTHHQGKGYRDQETLWRQTLDRNPAAWIAHNNLGEILVAQGKIDEALAHCRAALRLKPDLPEAHGNLANALYHKKEYGEAVERYEEVLRLDPDNPRAYGNMGAALEALERFDEAEAAFEEALRINPDFVNAHFNLGNMLVKLERFSEARAHLAAAVSLNAGFADAHFKLGLCLQEEGRADEAVRSYRRALALRPTWLEAANNLAWLLAVRPGATKEEGVEAVGLAEQLCRSTNRRAPELLDTHAAAYARTERYASAKRTAEEALGLAQSAGMVELADAIARRLRAYEKQQAWEE